MLSVSDVGGLLVAFDEFVKYWNHGWEFGAGSFIGTGNPDTVLAECGRDLQELRELNEIDREDDPYLITSEKLPPMQLASFRNSVEGLSGYLAKFVGVLQVGSRSL